MNIRNITSFFLGFSFLLSLVSCENDNTTTEYVSSSSDAQIYSFSMTANAPISEDSVQRAQDSIRFIQVNKTKFAINQVTKTIYNPDSLPYGTVLDSVKVELTFNPYANPAEVKIQTPNSVNDAGDVWNLKDSLYFGKQPIKFIIKATNNTTIRDYTIDIRTHKIDPDSMIWTQEASYPKAFGESKTILNQTVFYTYAMDGVSPVLYTSSKNNLSWAKQTLLGFPSTPVLESIYAKDGAFYVIDKNGNSYNSTDGKTWAILNNGKVITSILGVLPTSANNKLLLIYKDAGKYYFGTTEDLINVENNITVNSSLSNTEIPVNFPLKGAASYTREGANKNQKLLFLQGGLTSVGTELNTTWMIKSITQNSIEISAFSQNTQFKGTGLSLFGYGNDLLYVLSKNQLYMSSYSGQSWELAPEKQVLDSRIAARSGQTVIVDNENYIWIFGGVSGSTSLTDVWKGRLNSSIPKK